MRISSVVRMLKMVDDKTEQSEERFWRTFFLIILLLRRISKEHEKFLSGRFEFLLDWGVFLFFISSLYTCYHSCRFHSAHFLLIFALLPLSYVYPDFFFATCLILFILLRFRSGAWHLLLFSLQKAIGLYY